MAELTGKTQVVGIIGDPVSHSKSPQMHNAGFAELGLDFVYLPFPVKPEALGAAIAGVRALGIRGVNVTVPHKEAVIPFLDEVDPSARSIGAVNTIVNVEERLIGYNTDGMGFWHHLKSVGGPALLGKRVVILGAGGSVRALAWTALEGGAASVTILCRTVSKGELLAQSLNETFPGRAFCAALSTFEGLLEAHVVIQATTVGLGNDETVMTDMTWVRPGQWVADIVYEPRRTRFLQEAEAGGASVVEGLGMLLGQGVLAFEKFTGHAAPEDVMRRSLLGF